MTDDIRVQEQDFDQGIEYDRLAVGTSVGAVVTFVGRVRDFSSSSASMHLQHYPGMTEKSLEKIAMEAKQRWTLDSVTVIHRVGQLGLGEQIVFVGVSSKHRLQAFEACQFIMDYLKTRAPFWKREGESWVDAKASDERQVERWQSEK